MKVAVDHKREFRATFAVLFVFWAIAAVFSFLAWRVPAFVICGLGAMAAFERLHRIAKQGATRGVRMMARCLAALILLVVFGVGLCILLPALDHRLAK